MKKEQIILLGNEKKYFQSINDVIQCVNSNNKKFIFFNFIEDKVFQIDFNEKIKVFNFENKEELGFECQEITINYFLKFYYESEWGKDQMNKYNNQTEHIDNKNKESLTIIIKIIIKIIIFKIIMKLIIYKIIIKKMMLKITPRKIIKLMKILLKKNDGVETIKNINS